MRTEYLNDLNQNYLLVKYESDLQEFSLRMMCENRISGLISCELRSLNEEYWIYYEISGLQSIKNLFVKRSMSASEFNLLLIEWQKLRMNLPEYFLSDKMLLLRPDTIFYDMRTSHFYFTILPETFTEEILNCEEKLSEFLIRIIDHESMETVDKVYRLYDEMREGEVHLENYIMETEMFYNIEEKQKEPKTFFQKEDASRNTDDLELINGEESNQNDLFINKTEQDKGTRSDKSKNEEKTLINLKKSEKRKAVGLLSIIGAIVFLAVGIWQHKLPIESAIALATMGIAVILLLRMIIRLNHKADKKEAGMNKRKLREINQEKYDREAESEYQSMLNTEEAEHMETYQESSMRTIYIELTEKQERKLYGLGKNKSSRITLNEFPYTIGMNKEFSDFQLTDHSVSRVHARFFLEEDEVILMDLNSTNGTYHNGLRLQPDQKVRLEPEDEVGFGKVMFIYR